MKSFVCLAILAVVFATASAQYEVGVPREAESSGFVEDAVPFYGPGPAYYGGYGGFGGYGHGGHHHGHHGHHGGHGGHYRGLPILHPIIGAGLGGLVGAGLTAGHGGAIGLGVLTGALLG